MRQEKHSMTTLGLSLDEFRAILVQSGYDPYLERANPPGSDLMFFVGPDGIHFEVSENE